jgi:uncharacterized repeat protein (TIGR01451 family)
VAFLVGASAAVQPAGAAAQVAPVGPTTYTCANDVLSARYEVPAGASFLQVRIGGSKGGNASGVSGGNGAVIEATMPVRPRDDVDLAVGCTPGPGAAHRGGDAGTEDLCGNAGSPGGASSIVATGVHRLEAGGGGGAGGEGCGANDGGGAGGAGSQNGERGGDAVRQASGGAGGEEPSGDGGTGGEAPNTGGSGGGGGGGCAGGRGGGGAPLDAGGGGGGGGSSCVTGDLPHHYVTGGNPGNGTVTLAPVILTVDKTGTLITSGGRPDRIDYDVVITNGGAVPLTEVGADDPLVDLECSAGTLDPGEVLTCDATYDLTDADVNQGQVVNTVTVTGRAPSVGGGQDGQQVTATDTHTEPIDDVVDFRLDTVTSEVEDVESDGYEGGDEVTYGVTVRNNGTSAIAGISVGGTVSRDVPSPPPGTPLTFTCDDNDTPPVLQPGESTVCTTSAPYVITDGDVDTPNGAIVATISATGRTRAGQGPERTATAARHRLALAQLPGAEIDLAVSGPADANGSESIDAGDVATFTATVRNTGNVTLGNVTVTDELVAPPDGAVRLSCSPAQPAVLAPAGTMTCSGLYPLTQADIDRGSVTDTATVTGDGRRATQEVEVESAPAEIDIDQESGLVLALAVDGIDDTNANGRTGDAGDAITYGYRIRNSGTVSVEDVELVVVDEVAITCAPAAGSTLAGGATMRCEGVRTLTQGDVDDGTVGHTARAIGATTAGESVESEEQSIDVDLETVSALGLTAAAGAVVDTDGNDRQNPGDTIAYTIVVTNSGTTAISAMTVTAGGLSLVCAPEQGEALSPGQDMTCRGTRALTQEDLDAGSVLVETGAAGTGPNSQTVRATSAEVRSPLTQLGDLTAKAAVGSVEDRNANTRNDPGDVIVYQVRVTNNGNVTLTGVTGRMALTAPAGPAPGLTCPGSDTMAPAAAVTCTGSYRITTADAGARVVEATATAAGSRRSGPEVVSPGSSVRTAVELASGGGGGTGGTAGGGGGDGGGGTAGGGGGLASTGATVGAAISAALWILALGAYLVVHTRRRNISRT